MHTSVIVFCVLVVVSVIVAVLLKNLYPQWFRSASEVPSGSGDIKPGPVVVRPTPVTDDTGRVIVRPPPLVIPSTPTGDRPSPTGDRPSPTGDRPLPIIKPSGPGETKPRCNPLCKAPGGQCRPGSSVCECNSGFGGEFCQKQCPVGYYNMGDTVLETSPCNSNLGAGVCSPKTGECECVDLANHNATRCSLSSETQALVDELYKKKSATCPNFNKDGPTLVKNFLQIWGERGFKKEGPDSHEKIWDYVCNCLYDSRKRCFGTPGKTCPQGYKGLDCADCIDQYTKRVKKDGTSECVPRCPMGNYRLGDTALETSACNLANGAGACNEKSGACECVAPNFLDPDAGCAVKPELQAKLEAVYDARNSAQTCPNLAKDNVGTVRNFYKIWSDDGFHSIGDRSYPDAWKIACTCGHKDNGDCILPPSSEQIARPPPSPNPEGNPPVRPPTPSPVVVLPPSGPEPAPTPPPSPKPGDKKCPQGRFVIGEGVFKNSINLPYDVCNGGDCDGSTGKCVCPAAFASRLDPKTCGFSKATQKEVDARYNAKDGVVKAKFKQRGDKEATAENFLDKWMEKDLSADQFDAALDAANICLWDDKKRCVV